MTGGQYDYGSNYDWEASSNYGSRVKTFPVNNEGGGVFAEIKVSWNPQDPDDMPKIRISDFPKVK